MLNGNIMGNERLLNIFSHENLFIKSNSGNLTEDLSFEVKVQENWVGKIINLTG